MTLAVESGTAQPTSAPSAFPVGMSLYNVDPMEEEWPGPGMLIVIRGNSATGCTQIVHTYGQEWVRHSSASVWDAWVRRADVA